MNAECVFLFCFCFPEEILAKAEIPRTGPGCRGGGSGDGGVVVERRASLYPASLIVTIGMILHADGQLRGTFLILSLTVVGKTDTIQNYYNLI